MTFGQRVKKYREDIGMSQDELAQIIGYKSRSSINKIELDKNEATQTIICKLAKALKTTPGHLMGWADENNEQIAMLNIPSEHEKRTDEFIKLFTQLTQEQQKMIIAQIKGILAEDT